MNTILAIWGAGLSTILFILKILETYRDRSRIAVSSHFGPGDMDDSFRVANLSGKAINIVYYNFFLSINKSSEDRDYIETGNEGYALDIHLQAHSTITLEFNDQYYFTGNMARLKGKNLYIEIFIIGRKKPVTMLVASF